MRKWPNYLFAVFRSEGPEQAAYLESRLAAWLAEGVTVPEKDTFWAIPSSSRRVSCRWLVAAAAVLIVVVGTLLYFYRLAPVKQIHYVNNTGHIDTLLPVPGCTLITGKGASLAYVKGFTAIPKLHVLGGDTWFEVALPVRVRMQLDEHTDLYTRNAVFTVGLENRRAHVPEYSVGRSD